MVKVREIISELGRAGWVQIRQTGSQRHDKHAMPRLGLRGGKVGFGVWWTFWLIQVDFHHYRPNLLAVGIHFGGVRSGEEDFVALQVRDCAARW